MSVHRRSHAPRLLPRRIVSAREERRRLAYRWLRLGVAKTEIAERLGVTWWTVWNWDKRRRKEGAGSWRERRHPGPARRLTTEQRQGLLAILKKGARAYGYPTELWTLKRTAEVIRKEYGVIDTPCPCLASVAVRASPPRSRYELPWRGTSLYIRELVRYQVARDRRTGEADAGHPSVSRRELRPDHPERSEELGGGGGARCCDTKAVGRRSLPSRGSLSMASCTFDLYDRDMSSTEVIWFLERLLEEIPGRCS